MELNMPDIRGSKNPKWNGGRRKDKDGYVLVWYPYHPYRDSDSYVREHRLVMEEKLRRFLLPEEVVHHINNIKDDNRLENLVVMTAREHMSFHSSNRRDFNFVCSCGNTKHYGKGLCKRCYGNDWRKKNIYKVRKYNEKHSKKS